MNFTNMTIKGQGLIKKDNLMSPTGGEIKPTTRQCKTRGGPNFALRNSTNFGLNASPFVSKHIGTFNKKSGSGSIEKQQPLSTRNRGQDYSYLSQNRVFSQQTYRGQNSKTRNDSRTNLKSSQMLTSQSLSRTQAINSVLDDMRNLFANPTSQNSQRAKGTTPRPPAKSSREALPEIKEVRTRKLSIATDASVKYSTNDPTLATVQLLAQTNENTTAPYTSTVMTDTVRDLQTKQNSKVKIQDQASPGVTDRTNEPVFTIQERGSSTKKSDNKEQALVSSLCQKQIIERLKEKQRMKVQMTMQQYVKDPANKEKRIDFQERRPQVSTGPSFPRKNEKVDLPRDIMLGSLFFGEGNDFGASYRELSEMYKNLNPKKGHEKLSNKASKSFDINVLETWINETLREAEYFDIRGSIRRNTTEGGGGSTGKVQTVCMDYGIDRLTLNNTGINNESIDKIYRSLFTTTVGFFSQLKEVLNQQSDYLKLTQSKVTGHGVSKAPPDSFEGQKRHQTKASLLTALWRVYSVLTEYAYSTEYKLQIADIQIDGKAKLEEKQKQLNELMDDAEKKQYELREQLRYTQKDLRKTQDELKIAIQDRERMHQDMVAQTLQNEGEIALRMKFEEKLNNLYSLNRCFNEAAERNNNLYAQKAYQLDIVYEQFTASQNELQNTLSDLESIKQYKVIIDEKIVHQLEQIKTFKQINDEMHKQFDITNKENFDLKKEHRDQTDEFLKAKNELSNLREDFAAQTKLYEKVKHQYLNKSKQTTLFEGKYDELREQITVITDKANKFQNQFERADEQKEKLAKENEERRIKQYDLVAEVKKLSNELQTMTNSKEIAEYQLKMTEELNADTQIKIEYIDIDRTKQIVELREKKGNIVTLDTKIVDLLSTQSSLKEENQGLESRLQDTEFNLNEYKKSAYAKGMELETVKKNTGDKIAFLERKVEFHSTQAAKQDQRIKELEDESQKDNDLIKTYRAATDSQGNTITRLEQDITQLNELLTRAEENRKQLMAEKSSFFQQNQTLQMKLQKDHQMFQFMEGDKQRELDRVKEVLENLKASIVIEQMVMEDSLSTTLRALNKVEGLQNRIRLVTEENFLATQKVHQIEAEMRKVQKEMFVEQSKTKEETRKLVESEEEVGALKVERDGKIYIIETLMEKMRVKEEELFDLEVELNEEKVVTLSLREIIRDRKAIDDSKVEVSTQTEINYYPFTRNIIVFDDESQSSEKKTTEEQKVEDQQAENIVVLEKNTSKKSLSALGKVTPTEVTLEIPSTPHQKIQKKDHVDEDGMEFQRPESEHGEDQLPVDEEAVEEEEQEEEKVEVEDLSEYNLGDLTYFTDLIRENLKKVQKRVNKDKIVLEQFPYWDRYIDQDAQCEIIVQQESKEVENEDVQIRDIDGQMNIDIKLGDSTLAATARTKDNQAELTEEDDGEDVLAMKSKLPQSVEELQPAKTGKGKKKGQKQSKANGGDKQGKNQKKKAKNSSTNCCDPTCVCTCNMKNSPRVGGQATSKNPIQNMMSTAKISPERASNSPSVGHNPKYSQFKIGVQMSGAMRQAFSQAQERNVNRNQNSQSPAGQRSPENVQASGQSARFINKQQTQNSQVTPETDVRDCKEESYGDGATFLVENSRENSTGPLDQKVVRGPSQDNVDIKEDYEVSYELKGVRVDLQDPEITNIDIKKHIQNKMMQKIGTMVNQYGEQSLKNRNMELFRNQKRKTSVFGSHGTQMLLPDESPRSSRFTNEQLFMGLAVQTHEPQNGYQEQDQYEQEYGENFQPDTPSNIEIRTNLRAQTVASKKKPFKLIPKGPPNLRLLIKGAHTRD